MRRILGIVGGLSLGIVASQFPEYTQQYTQRLGGAVDELRVITERFDRNAAEHGLTRELALERFDRNADDFVADVGNGARADFLRYETLEATLAKIQGDSPWERLRHFPDYLDREIGRRTLQNYKPAVPVTWEGFAYAAAGALLGYLLTVVLLSLIGRLFWRRRATYP